METKAARVPRPGTAPAQFSSARARTGVIKRLQAASSAMNTATLAALEANHSWFESLDAESRSWISVLARSGIDGFVKWFSGEEFEPETVFDAAPRAMTQRISLQQTVDLVRTTTEVVEQQIQTQLPRGDRQALQLGIMHYSREIAFAAAGVYARAAEARGAWDSRIEATVVDAVVRAETDEAVLSRASTLGWHAESKVVVAIGGAADASAIHALRRAAAKLGLDLLLAPQGDRLVCIFGGTAITTELHTYELVAQLHDHFADGPVVMGPIADSLAGAARIRAFGRLGIPRRASMAGRPRDAAFCRSPPRARPRRRRARASHLGHRALPSAGRKQGTPRDLRGISGCRLLHGGHGQSAVRASQYGALPSQTNPGDHRLQPLRRPGGLRAPDGHHARTAALLNHTAAIHGF